MPESHLNGADPMAEGYEETIEMLERDKTSLQQGFRAIQQLDNVFWQMRLFIRRNAYQLHASSTSRRTLLIMCQSHTFERCFDTSVRYLP